MTLPISFTIMLSGFVIVFGSAMVLGAFWLEKIRKLALRGLELATTTHQIVNSQRSAMQSTIYLLAKRVADENPKDEMAQKAMDRAKMELDLMDRPRRAAI